jgi:uncharacterized membrane protein
LSNRSIRLSAPIIVLFAAVAAYAVYFSVLTLTRYAAFESRALDMGNLNQAIWNTARGNWFHLTNQPGTINRLSLHVEPILIPISWLYWIRSGPPTLLVLQAAIVALGAIPTYAIARYKDFGAWAALAFAFAFLLNPSIQAANWLEFHPITLAPTFLIAAFYFLVTGRTGWFSVFAVLAASCKEEIALLVFMMGVYAILALSRPRLGVVTMLLSLAWALIAVFVIQNAFAEGNIHWNRYQYLGETPAEMLGSLLTKPAVVFEQLRSAAAGRYLLQIVLPLAFLPLIGLEILALALPSFALNLLADFEPMHQVYTLIYAAPIAAIAVIASVYGARRLVDWGTQVHGGQYARLRDAMSGGTAAVVLVFALGAALVVGYVPGGANFILFHITDHDRRAAAILDLIPIDAKVSAQDRLDPHVSGRETIYIFPRIEDADTVLVDATGPAWPQHPSDLRNSVNALLDEGYGIAAADDGYLLLHRDGGAAELPKSFFSAWQRPDHVPEAALEVDFGDALRLIDYDVLTDSYGETVVSLYWQALRPLEEDYRFYVAFRNRDGDTLYDTLYYPPSAVLWYPTSQWPPGETTLVQTLPWAVEEEPFALTVGVYAGDEGWLGSGRLPITHSEPWVPTLENGTLARLGGFVQDRSGAWRPLTMGDSKPQTTVQVRFGEAIALDGATLPQRAVKAGGELAFTLYWRAIGEPDKDYAAFAHLLNSDGVKVAQHDWQPRDAAGPRPATTWRHDEALIDSETMQLPANLEPGNYRIIVGLYNWEDGERLRATGPDAEPDDVITVGTVEIK